MLGRARSSNRVGREAPPSYHHRSARSRPASRSGGTFREDGVRAYERGGSFARPSLWKNPSPPPAKKARQQGWRMQGEGQGWGERSAPDDKEEARSEER